MNMTMTINRTSDPTPYSFTKMLVHNVEDLDNIVAEIGNGKGDTKHITLREALEIYALWTADRIDNSDKEIAYMQAHKGEQLPPFKL